MGNNTWLRSLMATGQHKIPEALIMHSSNNFISKGGNTQSKKDKWHSITQLFLA